MESSISGTLLLGRELEVWVWIGVWTITAVVLPLFLYHLVINSNIFLEALEASACFDGLQEFTTLPASLFLICFPLQSSESLTEFRSLVLVSFLTRMQLAREASESSVSWRLCKWEIWSVPVCALDSLSLELIAGSMKTTEFSLSLHALFLAMELPAPIKNQSSHN